MKLGYITSLVFRELLHISVLSTLIYTLTVMTRIYYYYNASEHDTASDKLFAVIIGTAFTAFMLSISTTNLLMHCMHRPKTDQTVIHKISFVSTVQMLAAFTVLAHFTGLKLISAHSQDSRNDLAKLSIQMEETKLGLILAWSAYITVGSVLLALVTESCILARNYQEDLCTAIRNLAEEEVVVKSVMTTRKTADEYQVFKNLRSKISK